MNNDEQERRSAFEAERSRLIAEGWPATEADAEARQVVLPTDAVADWDRNR